MAEMKKPIFLNQKGLSARNGERVAKVIGRNYVYKQSNPHFMPILKNGEVEMSELVKGNLTITVPNGEKLKI